MILSPPALALGEAPAALVHHGGGRVGLRGRPHEPLGPGEIPVRVRRVHAELADVIAYLVTLKGVVAQ